MDLLLEPFAAGFTQRALAAGLLVALTCAVVGVWVVLRSLAFMGDALAHGIVPGIAVAALLGGNLTLGAAVSAAVTVGGVALVGNRARLPEDTGIGLLFVGMLSLGVLVISRSDSFATDVTAFLFGDTLGVTWQDVRAQAVSAVIAVAASVLGYRAFLALAFDERKAELLGLRPRLARAALLALIALAIISAFRTVGSLLVFGLLVAPAATATLVVRRVPALMVTAAGLGMLAVVVGLALSYHLDLAGGAAVSCTAVVGFFLALAGRGAVDVGRSRRAASAERAGVPLASAAADRLEGNG